MTSPGVVLDASALMALLRDEPGADKVAAVLTGALISAVNYSEILKKTIERGGESAPVAAFIRSLGITIVTYDEAQAVVSADLYTKTKKHGMSFADRACLALGVTRKLPVLTAERAMAAIRLPIKIQVIR